VFVSKKVLAECGRDHTAYTRRDDQTRRGDDLIADGMVSDGSGAVNAPSRIVARGSGTETVGRCFAIEEVLLVARVEVVAGRDAVAEPLDVEGLDEAPDRAADEVDALGVLLVAADALDVLLVDADELDNLVDEDVPDVVDVVPEDVLKGEVIVSVAVVDAELLSDTASVVVSTGDTSVVVSEGNSVPVLVAEVVSTDS